MSRTAVVGIFDDCLQSSRAISALRDANFVPQSIFAICACSGQLRQETPETTTATVCCEPESVRDSLAKVGGWAVPPTIVALAGNISIVLAGHGAGSVAPGVSLPKDGVITNFLVGLAVPEFDAMVYEALVGEGKCLVIAANCDHDSRKRAAAIMDRCQTLKLRTAVNQQYVRTRFAKESAEAQPER